MTIQPFNDILIFRQKKSFVEVEFCVTILKNILEERGSRNFVGCLPPEHNIDWNKYGKYMYKVNLKQKPIVNRQVEAEWQLTLHLSKKDVHNIYLQRRKHK